ncbi:Zinc finger, RING-type [Dillenia turbinata]|uniref:Zinc finger, RING-type n=1 Tax=Dillenia turbinata TaxID=194707 RepID=A0AAN8UJ94_9MAGN
MGLEDYNNTLDDGDGGGNDGDDGGGGSKAASSVSCSICLEVVADNGDRSWAKLQCGHQFHLDCIGSAFNVKGAMQCPNCRKIEKGQWLFATGCRPFPEFNMDDRTPDEDLYDLSYAEMAVGFHWCPFSGSTRVQTSFDEGDLSSTAYHDLLGQHAFFAEHSAVSSTHPCPYIAYFGPIHPSSSNSNGSVSESSNFNNHWNGPSVPSEMSNSYVFPTMDLHYHSWEHSSPFSNVATRMGGDQPSVSSVNQRSVRANSDMQRSGSYMHPFVIGHSSGARAGSSVGSSMSPYPGINARARDRVQALQAYYQQQPSNPTAMRTPLISGSRRFTGHRGMTQVGPMASSSDQTGGFYFFPSVGSSAHSFQDAENNLSNHFHALERDHLPSFILNQVDRESGWGTFHQVASGSDNSSRSSSFRQRSISERTRSQNRS